MSQIFERKKLAVYLLIVFIGIIVSACNLTGSPEQALDITNVPTGTGTQLPTRTPPGTRTVPTALPLTSISQPTRSVFFPPTAVVAFPQNFVPFPTNTPLPVSIFILSPLPGNTVAGSVQVLGSASHPLFLQYQLEFGPDPNPGNLWYPASSVSQVPILNGLLGLWNTTSTQDGTYLLRLRVFLRDGTDLSTVVNNIRVQNRVATSIPTPTSNVPRPIAAFTQDFTTGNAPLVVRFTNLSQGDVNLYTWDFGDGSGSTEISPTHTFRAPGVYNVVLTASGPGGASNVTRQIVVNGTNAPIAAFTQNRVSGPTPLTVQFTNQSSGAITTYDWNFGDGTTSNQQSPSHTFTAVGTYNVILRVTGSGGSSSVTRQFTVENPQIPPPDAIFAANVTEGFAPLTVYFASQSTGQITNHSWDFADGATNNYELTPVHTYTNPGTYVVTMTVVGPGGQDAQQMLITVNRRPDAPVASFSANPTEGDFELEVDFTNNSQRATRYEWTFGDGDTSTDEEPTHTYDSAGTYTVTLRAFGDGGEHSTTGRITVTQPIAPPEAAFEVEPDTTGTAPFDVDFRNTSNGDNLEFLWNFDGTATSPDRDPSFTFEVAGVYDVTLRASNSEGEDVATVRITVTSGNVAPTDISLSATAIDEGVANGTVVGTLNTTDANPGDTFTYSLVNNPNNTFAIAGNELRVAVDGITDDTYPIRIRTTDAEGATYEEDFSIVVSSVNQAPTGLTLAGTDSVNQDAPVGTVVGTLSTNDPNPGDTHIYTLVGGNGQFQIVGSELQVAGALTVGDSDITITTTDQGDLTYSEDYTISVTAVNQAPTNLTLSGSDSVNQDAPVGTVVGSLSTEDPDAGDTHTYTVSDPSGQFQIAGTELQVAGPLVVGFYGVTLTTTDQGGLSYSEDYTIEVTAVNQPPSNIDLSNLVIMADSTTVGTITVTDADDASHTLTVSDPTFAISGSELVVVGTLSAPEYSITLTATDSASNVYSENFTITVSASNQPPTDITPNSFSIAQDATTVGTLTVTDADDTTHTLTVSDPTFAISGNDLVVAGTLSPQDYVVTVTATDSAGNEISRDITITVTEVAPPPPTGQFVYVSEGDIWVSNFDGSNTVNVTSAGSNESDPTWSADGQFIIFVSDISGPEQIYLLNVNDPGTITPLPDGVGDNPIAAPVVGNSQVMFVSGRSGTQQIYVVDALNPSATATLLGDGVGENYDPVWSPDGSRIAFVSERDGQPPQIYVLDIANPGVVTRISDGAGPDTMPAWSSTNKIVFVSTRFGDADIFVMNPDGTGLDQLTEETSNETNPGWSPDGSQIVFFSDRDPSGTYVMNADGNGVVHISTSTAQAISPVWRP